MKRLSDRYKAVFEHDSESDFSWLEQDIFNPSKPGYEPIYRSQEDMEAGREPIDGEWYRDPANHVALHMMVYRLAEDAEDWEPIDSLGNIDFLEDSDDWCTGTFYSPADLPERCGYQRELFEQAIAEAVAA